jgi:hypothetical protein
VHAGMVYDEKNHISPTITELQQTEDFKKLQISSDGGNDQECTLHYITVECFDFTKKHH